MTARVTGMIGDGVAPTCGGEGRVGVGGGQVGVHVGAGKSARRGGRADLGGQVGGSSPDLSCPPGDVTRCRRTYPAACTVASASS